MTAMEGTIPADRLTVIPANGASWDDIAAIFGTAHSGRAFGKSAGYISCQAVQT